MSVATLSVVPALGPSTDDPVSLWTTRLVQPVVTGTGCCCVKEGESVSDCRYSCGASTDDTASLWTTRLVQPVVTGTGCCCVKEGESVRECRYSCGASTDDPAYVSVGDKARATSGSKGTGCCCVEEGKPVSATLSVMPAQTPAQMTLPLCGRQGSCNQW